MEMIDTYFIPVNSLPSSSQPKRKQMPPFAFPWIPAVVPRILGILNIIKADATRRNGAASPGKLDIIP